MDRAFLFPGQGSQSVGMAKELADAFPAARETLQEVDHTLGQDLSGLMFEGPEDTLTLTENAQPAIMAASMASLAVLRAEGAFDLAASGRFVAGHSLGEYSALAAAGALSLADTARLLRIRGEAMQKAVPVGEGAMAAIMGLEWDDVAALAAEAEAGGGVCTAANDNAPGQIVISGSKDAVERAMELAKAKGAKRALPLPVSAPFHSPLMAPAADAMAEALANVSIQTPVLPVIANVTAEPVSDPDDIRRLLVAQVTGSVRWRESVQYLVGRGIDTVVEIGAGKVISGLAKRIDRSLTAVSVGTPADVEAFLESL